MGSVTDIKGEIIIDPPIPWNLCKDSEFMVREDEWSSPLDLKLRMVEVQEESERGTLIRRHADAIVSRQEETRATYLLEELQQIVDEFGEGRTFTGRLDMTCRDFMEQWRAKIVDGRAVRFDPVITWPEASE